MPARKFSCSKDRAARHDAHANIEDGAMLDVTREAAPYGATRWNLRGSGKKIFHLRQAVSPNRFLHVRPETVELTDERLGVESFWTCRGVIGAVCEVRYAAAVAGLFAGSGYPAGGADHLCSWVGRDGSERKTRRCRRLPRAGPANIRELEAALQASGASFDNVVKLNGYFVDMTQLPVFRELRDKYINKSAPPASTAVRAGLFREGFLVEVEAVAVVPE